jgi:hypothetical protein
VRDATDGIGGHAKGVSGVRPEEYLGAHLVTFDGTAVGDVARVYVTRVGAPAFVTVATEGSSDRLIPLAGAKEVGSHHVEVAFTAATIETSPLVRPRLQLGTAELQATVIHFAADEDDDNEPPDPTLLPPDGPVYLIPTERP